MLCRESMTFVVLAWHNVGNIHVRHMKYKCKQAFRRTCRVGINAHKTENIRIRGNRYLALPYFPHYLLNSTIFGGEGEITEHKVCFGFLCNFCLEYYSL
jgi:hypothetical protein